MAESSPAKKTVPRGIRLLVRVWGTISALCFSITGLVVIITLTAACFAIGVFQIFAGLIILPLEAPLLCSYFSPLVTMSNWVEDHFRFWMRAALYMCFALPPSIFCFELSTFIASASVLVTAALYGVLAIGRKGSDAPAKSKDDVEMKANLVNKDGEANEETGL